MCLKMIGFLVISRCHGSYMLWYSVEALPLGFPDLSKPVRIQLVLRRPWFLRPKLLDQTQQFSRVLASECSPGPGLGPGPGPSPGPGPVRNAGGLIAQSAENQLWPWNRTWYLQTGPRTYGKHWKNDGNSQDTNIGNIHSEANSREIVHIWSRKLSLKN